RKLSGRPKALNQTALFALPESEQHHLGICMVDELFRLNGWSSELLIPASIDDLERTVKATEFGLIGFSLANDSGLTWLKEAIRMIRRVDPRRKSKIVVGGSLFISQPRLVYDVGADQLARDANHALDIIAQMEETDQTRLNA
ncbi:MAG: cobalamin B12-binding domain-containing protein, partial [Pseudomonadota bacterium]